MSVITNENLDQAKKILLKYYFDVVMDSLEENDIKGAISTLAMCMLDMKGNIEDIQDAFEMLELETETEFYI